MPNLEPYGNHWGGDGLFNMRIGYCETQGAYRFVARQTVQVNRLRYFNTYSLNKDGTIKKPGYHSGNGGKIRIELRPDDGTPSHSPSETVLAKALVKEPLKVDEQLLVQLDRVVTLKAGEIYHVVFSNDDIDPDRNYVSLDMMAIMTPRDLSKPEQPHLAPFDMTTLTRNKYNRKWLPFKSNLTCTPIFTMYHDDRITVSGYGCMESWVATPKPIAGGAGVRQVFRPSREIEVENVAVRLAKNGNPGPLKASLRMKSEAVVEGAVPSGMVAPIDLVTLKTNRLGHQWVTIPFSTRVRLTPNLTYFLELSAPAGDAYEIFPLRDGSHGFGYSSVWPDAWAEFKPNEATPWTGWDPWGSKDQKISHLQLYFNA